MAEYFPIICNAQRVVRIFSAEQYIQHMELAHKFLKLHLSFTLNQYYCASWTTSNTSVQLQSCVNFISVFLVLETLR